MAVLTDASVIITSERKGVPPEEAVRLFKDEDAALASITASELLVGVHDLIIAATAVAQGYAVLTDNVREFRHVPGLVVRQPAW